MATLTIDDFKTLFERPNQNCVSIYFSTHPAGLEVRQDPIRFKNLTHVAAEKLVEQGMREADAHKLLAPAYELDRPEFWRHQNQGLALFVAENFFRYYRLPLDFEELVVVEPNHFQLKPLMPLLTGDGRFYILALSKNQVRLMEGTRDRVREINLHSLEEVPESLRQAVRQYQDQENQTQFETVSAYSPGGLSGSDPGTLHGRGVDEDPTAQLVGFLSTLNKGLSDYLEDSGTPLVLACVDELVHPYRRVNTYPYLLEEHVSGNPDLPKPEELHAQAWTIVQPHFQQAQKEAAERYAQFSGNHPDLVSGDVSESLQAAYFGRVDTLFVARDRHHWGRFYLDNNFVKVELHDSQQSGDEDLLNLTAMYTLINGGTVYAVPPEHVPADSDLAAIFRYGQSAL